MISTEDFDKIGTLGLAVIAGLYKFFTERRDHIALKQDLEILASLSKEDKDNYNAVKAFTDQSIKKLYTGNAKRYRADDLAVGIIFLLIPFGSYFAIKEHYWWMYLIWAFCLFIAFGAFLNAFNPQPKKGSVKKKEKENLSH